MGQRAVNASDRCNNRLVWRAARPADPRNHPCASGGLAAGCFVAIFFIADLALRYFEKRLLKHQWRVLQTYARGCYKKGFTLRPLPLSASITQCRLDSPKYLFLNHP